MHPLLFKIGPVPIHTYGFLIAIGFLTGVYVVKRLSERSGLPADRVVDLSFWILLVGFTGSRLLFVITRWEYFAANPLAVFRLWEGGLVFYGGPILVVPFVVLYLRRYQLSVWKVLDVLTPGLVIAHMFGRFGCLSAGCCFGKPTGMDFGVILHTDLVDPIFRGIKLHPTQLYAAVGLFLIFLGLIWVFRKKKFDGQVVLTYFMVYPIVRSVIEVFRGDKIRGFLIEDILSTSQFLSLLVFIGAATFLVFRLRAVNRSASSVLAGGSGQSKQSVGI